MDPSVSAALQQMQQQMQQQFAAMQQQMMQQVAHMPTPIVDPQAAAPRADRPRLPAPPSYDGRSAAALDGWLRELQQQFDWYRMIDDAARLQFVGALLKGVALDWWGILHVPVTTLDDLPWIDIDGQRMRSGQLAYATHRRHWFRHITKMIVKMYCVRVELEGDDTASNQHLEF